jgi:hypothetical protein
MERRIGSEDPTDARYGCARFADPIDMLIIPGNRAVFSFLVWTWSWDETALIAS